jgi:nicotinamidase-related amidase
VFHQTNLDLILKANNISELYLTGVSTEMAIQSTARDACDRDYKVTVIADACAGGSPEGYQSSIEVLKSISNVISTEELI